MSDQGDCAVELANDEIRSQLVEIETRELAQVEHALLRIAIGACGRCESCNRKIPVTRLNVVSLYDQMYQMPAPRRGARPLGGAVPRVRSIDGCL